MNRRGFLQSCIALAVAPAIVRADSLMKIIPVDTTLITGFDLAAAKGEGTAISFIDVWITPITMIEAPGTIFVYNGETYTIPSEYKGSRRQWARENPRQKNCKVVEGEPHLVRVYR